MRFPVYIISHVFPVSHAFVRDQLVSVFRQPFFGSVFCLLATIYFPGLASEQHSSFCVSIVG